MSAAGQRLGVTVRHPKSQSGSRHQREEEKYLPKVNSRGIHETRFQVARAQEPRPPRRIWSVIQKLHVLKVRARLHDLDDLGPAYLPERSPVSRPDVDQVGTAV